MFIVSRRVAEISTSYRIRAAFPADDAIEKIVTIFGELRQGEALDHKQKIKTPSGIISTAEAISLILNSMALAASFGNGTVVKDESKDMLVWKEYLENVMKKRGTGNAGFRSS